MPLYNKKGFSSLTGINNKDISIYKRRQKIVYTIIEGKEMIDSDDPINQAFIEERTIAMAKKGKPVQAKIDAPIAGNRQEKKEGEPGGSNIYDLVEEKKALDVEIAKREIIKRDMDIEKKRGEVIPVSPIENIVFKYKQYLITQQKIAYEAFLNEIGQKYAMVGEDIAYYRGRFIKGINNSFTTADTDFTNNLELILQDFSIKRGVGERE